MIRNSNHNQGFTLIELLLYIALIGLIIGAISVFLSLIWRSQVKAEITGVVESDGYAISRLIVDNIKNASGINEPAIGASSTLLSLTTTTIANNPIIIDLAANKVRIKEGISPVIELNSSNTVVSDLLFYNFSRTSANDSIRGQFTVSHVNSSNTGEYEYSKVFYFTSSRR